MIPKTVAGEEISRLVGLDFFPNDKKGVAELVTALSFSATEEIATAVIDEWLETERQRPMPVDLRRMVGAKNEARADKLAAASAPTAVYCIRCQDCGLYGGHIGTAYDGPWKWCDCAAARRRMEREPHLVIEANSARNKLLALYPDPARNPVAGHRHRLDDAYHGEF